MNPTITALAISARHSFSKTSAEHLILLEGLGIQGDAHMGVTVRHRSRVARDPSQPNLRQVHLVHQELFDELATQGFKVSAGDMGENVTTQGIDLLSLPRGTKLTLGNSAILQVTGLRNPCKQLDAFQDGLMTACLDRDDDGNLVRKAGVMAIVLKGGTVGVGNKISVELPPKPHHPLERV